MEQRSAGFNIPNIDDLYPASCHPVLLELISQPQLLLPAFSFHIVAGARRQRRQGENKLKIVVRRDTVEALEIAAQAAMNENVFPVGTLKTANWLHSAAAGASAITYLPVIDMT